MQRHAVQGYSFPARLWQRRQNRAARLITVVGIRDHITPVLKELHWLPVELRIHFKVLLYIFKALRGQVPQ